MLDFSIIIPNYNHAPYLKRRIDSVLAQTYDSYEVIILDDCSTDNSREVIESYRSHPKVVHIVYNEQNTGNTFEQWHMGIMLSKGSWIWMAESDDWSEPTFLNEMVSLIQKYPGTTLAYCQSLRVYDNGEATTTYADSFESQLKGREWIIKHMLGNCGLENASMAVFKKSVFETVSKSFTEFRQCGDWFFWCQIAKSGSVAISGKYLNYFRKHANNVTTLNWKEGYFFSEGSEIFKRLKEQLQLTSQEVEFGLNRFLLQFDSNRPIFSTARYKELMEKIISIDPDIAMEFFRRQRTAKRTQAIKAALRKILPI